MAKHHNHSKQEPGLAKAADGVIEDTQRLIGQHFELLRTEVKQELAEAKEAAVSMGAGAGLAALGGICGAFMAVHLMHSATRLPLWCCYGLVGGALGGAGAGLLYAGGKTAAGIRLVPPETAETLKEGADWVKQKAAEVVH